MSFPIKNPPETEEELAELRRQAALYAARKARKKRITEDEP